MKESSSQIAYNRLLEIILRGVLVPGEKIDEVELAGRFGVSRTPLREAIRRLQSEELVTVEPKKGARVKRLSIEEVEELYTVRTTLESLAVKIAGERFNKKSEQRLLKFKENFELAYRAEKPMRWLDENILFHYYFPELSGNLALFQIIKNLNMRLHKYRYITVMHPKWIEKYMFQHTEIIDNLIERSPSKAAKIMQRHLNTVRKDLISHLKEFALY